MYLKILVLLFLCINSCGVSDKTTETLVVAVPIEAIGLFPYTANDPNSSRIYNQLFDTLVTRDLDGNIIPKLATSWEYISPTVLEFTIQENISFHNGDLLTLEDIQFSFEKILSTPNLAHTVGAIERTEIANQKFRVILKEPYAPLISLMSYPTFKIINKNFFLSNESEIAQHPMGTGPYKLKEWNRGQNIVLERFDDYWGDVAKIKEINFRTVGDPVSRALSLETGDVHIAYELEGNDKERILDNSNLKWTEREIPRVEYIAMNIGKGSNPLWKTSAGRNAFAYAIDYQGIINSVLFGLGKEASSLLSPVVSGFSSNIPIRNRDLEKAKQFLQETGISNPQIKLWVREGTGQKIGEVIQANLYEIGVTVNIEVVEYARFLEGIAQGEHDAFILNWSTVTADADYGLNNLVNSGSWGSKGNRSFYMNTDIDTLLLQGRKTLDENKRKIIYEQIQKKIFDDVPYIPLYYTILGVGLQKNIQGFQFDIFADFSLNTVYFE